jgi:hypothetical protein
MVSSSLHLFDTRKSSSTPSIKYEEKRKAIEEEIK